MSEICSALTSPLLPLLPLKCLVLVLLRECCCKSIVQGKNVDTEKIIPERSKADFICAWHATHMLFKACNSDEGPSGTRNSEIQQVGRVVTVEEGVGNYPGLILNSGPPPVDTTVQISPQNYTLIIRLLNKKKMLKCSTFGSYSIKTMSA